MNLHNFIHLLISFHLQHLFWVIELWLIHNSQTFCLIQSHGTMQQFIIITLFILHKVPYLTSSWGNIIPSSQDESIFIRVDHLIHILSHILRYQNWSTVMTEDSDFTKNGIPIQLGDWLFSSHNSMRTFFLATFFSIASSFSPMTPFTIPENIWSPFDPVSLQLHYMAHSRGLGMTPT